MLRLFWAVEIQPEVKMAIAGIVKQAKDDLLDPRQQIRWVAPENMHVTLKFMGETSPEVLDAIYEAGSTSLQKFPPIHSRVQGFGAYRSRRGPSVLWAGVEDGGMLCQMAGELEGALETVGFKRDRRPYSGHITLARLRSHHLIGSALNCLSRYPIDVPLTVEAITLFRSELNRSGPTYIPMARVLLQAKEDEG